MLEVVAPPVHAYVNGTEPVELLATSVTLFPLQIVEALGVTVGVGAVLTVIETVFVFVQPVAEIVSTSV
jgi:hypothetical protein